jgi:SulP family sulfate permease
VGVIYSALVFAWNHAKQIHVTSKTEQNTKIYHLHGPLFFSSTQRFLTLFDTDNDPSVIILDFANSRVTDHSAIDAINTLTERYARKGKSVHLRHLSSDCRQLLKKADTLIEINIVEDPTYKVVTDTLA